VARLPLLLALLAAVERRYMDLRQGHSPRGEWAARLVTVGQRVVVSGAGRSLEGRVEGVDGDGALLLRLADGRQERILAGDVTLKPPERPAVA
jgi:BirA family biotin operon repressor/biotin-[acetyl-CoA-carboxylase] ligase